MVAININKLCDFAKLRDCFSIKRIEGDKSFRLGVQYKCLKSWYDLKKRSPDISYVQIINGFLKRSFVLMPWTHSFNHGFLLELFQIV